MLLAGGQNITAWLQVALSSSSLCLNPTESFLEVPLPSEIYVSLKLSDKSQDQLLNNNPCLHSSFTKYRDYNLQYDTRLVKTRELG